MDRQWAGIQAGAALTLFVLAWAWWAIKGRKWLRKCRRRRPGIYLVRTRKHGARPIFSLRENGYVGESVNTGLRWQDHLGRGRHGNAAKNWSDLDPVFTVVIRLPWWLGWKWVLRPLETLVILWKRPRYNVSKNRWNPRRIPPYVAAVQRRQRDLQRRFS